MWHQIPEAKQKHHQYWGNSHRNVNTLRQPSMTRIVILAPIRVRDNGIETKQKAQSKQRRRVVDGVSECDGSNGNRPQPAVLHVNVEHATGRGPPMPRVSCGNPGPSPVLPPLFRAKRRSPPTRGLTKVAPRIAGESARFGTKRRPIAPQSAAINPQSPDRGALRERTAPRMQSSVQAPELGAIRA